MPRYDPKKLLQFADGAMIERFGHFDTGSSKEAIASFIDATLSTAKDGKIVVLKAWPGFSYRQPEINQTQHNELVQRARESITFPLACFLVAAQENSYLCYTWGYREKHGTFDWYPEFDKPLGQPKGEAEKDGWNYHRDFAHASVFVNLETKKARIDWKP